VSPAPVLSRPLVMGVLNVTPDSFYDGGRYVDASLAIARGHQILDEGADIVDVGGESTRPGASPVSLTEELARVLPVLEALAADTRISSGAARLSIDTRHLEVAERAVAAGASIVNDVSGSSELASVAADTGAAYVAMHSKPDLHGKATYDDVVAEVITYLGDRADAAKRAGVGEVMVDPGIGFSKTARHNLMLLAELPRIVSLGWPVLVGTSRKRFIGSVAAGGPEAEPLGPKERFEGSLASAVWSMSCGAACVRVHDVRATVEAARLIEAVAQA
jgi:dihydropteroate synthase